MDPKALFDALTSSTINYLVLTLIAFAVALILSKVGQGLMRACARALANNWQLALLGSTGVVLSLASGYTTFDGLRNFTRAPLLSVMISFGIQGVMLIVAWLIGESFAAGMSRRLPSGRRLGPLDAILGMVLALALAGLVFYLVLHQFDAVTWTKTATFEFDWNRFASVAIYYALALLILALIAFNFRSGGEIAIPYVQSVRVIAKNVVLWVMFLASMTASVFFSFDSHFNAIFPQEERKRAAEIRSVAQVGAVVSDIGSVAQKRLIEEAEVLFRSEGWHAYETELDKVVRLAAKAPDAIREEMSRELEAQRQRIAKLEEQRATAQGGQAGLATRKTQLTEELSRIQAERPEAAQKTLEQKQVVSEIEKRFDEQRAKTLAEEKGVEGSLKVGRGQFYRASKAEQEKISSELQVARERLKSHETRLFGIDKRIASINGELAQVDGELAKRKGESDAVGQMIAIAQSGSRGENAARSDPASVAAALERERQSFRQRPLQEVLANLQSLCSSLQGASMKAARLRDEAAAIDCDPKQASEAAARVFALNAGLLAFQANCGGGDKLPQEATTDVLLQFGRKCLQHSALTSGDSTVIGAKLSAIDMNRDDKAHRFVVTWNAFMDGNRLAYLSLVLAIGVDALVFMSGLFGAQALRSPLTDVPSDKARSAKQLEAIIEAALLPDTFKKARLARSAMRPIEQSSVFVRSFDRSDGYTHEVQLDRLDPETARNVSDVLNAGATIGAVRHADRSDRYLVRGELYEFLCEIMNRELKHNPEEAKLEQEAHELETRISEALMPNEGEAAEAVLEYLHPIDERDGFTSEIFVNEVAPDHRRPVRNVLTAGASLRVVQRDRTRSDRYYLHTDLYKTLARIRAREFMAGAGPQLQIAGAQRLHEAHSALPNSDDRRDSLLKQIASGHSSAGQRSSEGPSAGNSDEALRREYWSELLGAVNADVRRTNERLRDADVAKAASEAWSALRAYADSSPRLAQLLRHHQEERERSLRAAYNALWSDARGDQRRIELLNEVHTDVQHVFPALLIFPENGLLDWLIEQLDQAAQEDGAPRLGEELLREALRRLKNEMLRLDLADAGAWRRIAAHLRPSGQVLKMPAMSNRKGRA